MVVRANENNDAFDNGFKVGDSSDDFTGWF